MYQMNRLYSSGVERREEPIEEGPYSSAFPGSRGEKQSR
jgi:hypothetical protein